MNRAQGDESVPHVVFIIYLFTTSFTFTEADPNFSIPGLLIVLNEKPDWSYQVTMGGYHTGSFGSDLGHTISHTSTIPTCG